MEVIRTLIATVCQSMCFFWLLGDTSATERADPHTLIASLISPDPNTLSAPLISPDVHTLIASLISPDVHTLSASLISPDPQTH
jgi:hypothetical protein